MHNEIPPTTFYIVRHGESVANVEKTVAGHFDSPLTPNGEAQARNAGEVLARIDFDAAFSSDLIRARRTAEIITANRNIAVTARSILRERFCGRFEGGPSINYQNALKAYIAKFGEITDEQRRKVKFENIENDDELATRLTIFLREASLAYPGKSILVVAHGGIMRALLMHLGFAKSSELPAGSVQNTAYIKLESDGVDFFVRETKGIEKRIV